MCYKTVCSETFQSRLFLKLGDNRPKTSKGKINKMESNNRYEIQRFLKEIASINLKYEKLNVASGSNFNLFSIIRKGTEEVELHSRFIGELLDPKGSHNQKDLFLKLFIKQLNIRNKNNQIIEGEFELSIEKSVGEYGRIDLFIKSKDELIIIENKIYANDQDKQLQRYSDAAKQFYGNHNVNLFYLTLQGYEPSPKSKGNLKDEDVVLISYVEHMKGWLEACEKEVNDIAVLRETITQYRQLIGKLTGQPINKKHIMEVQNLLLSDNNFEHALTVEAAITDSKIEIQKRVWKELQLRLVELRFDFSFVDSSFKQIDTDICDDFYAVRDKSRLYGLQYEVFKIGDYSVHLYIEVDACLYFGLTVCKNGVKGDFNNEFKEEYPNLANVSSIHDISTTDNSRWLGWKYTSEQVNFRNFHEGNTAKIANIAFRKTFIEAAVMEVCDLIDICKKQTSGL